MLPLGMRVCFLRVKIAELHFHAVVERYDHQECPQLDQMLCSRSLCFRTIRQITPEENRG